jgi:threonine dehydratase
MPRSSLPNDSPTLRDIFAARRRIRALVERTPLVRSERLSEMLGSEVRLKLECLQETGSFKARGAANKLLALANGERSRGLIAFSTGIHGRAVANLGRRLGLSTVICLSERVPAWRVETMREMGAEVIAHGRSQDEAYARALELQEERGLTMIAPFDDPLIIAGQGTVAVEILEDCPEVAQVVVPLSGGGLFSGVSLTLKNVDPGIKAVGVSMAVAPAMIRSLKAGRPVEIPEEDSLADALLGGIGLNNRYTFALTKKYLDRPVLVSEPEIAAGLFELFSHHRLMVEGSGAVGPAAILAGKIKPVAGPTVVVISGGNVNPQLLTKIADRRYRAGPGPNAASPEYRRD